MSASRIDPSGLIDLERYPVTALQSERAREVVSAARADLSSRGVAILPNFVRPDALARMTREVEVDLVYAHREDVWGTPYLELPDEAFPDGHPRRTSVHSITWVVAYDVVPDDSSIRALYEWESLKAFVGKVLGKRRLYRYADPLGALNLTCMVTDDVQGWHYDATDFVVSLAIQSSESGGDFECVPNSRTDDDERYDEIRDVLSGKARERVEVVPMTPGTLMIFHGRNSIHRVAPVEGGVPRYVALFAYDTKPDTNSSDLLKLVRYGRTEPRVHVES